MERDQILDEGMFVDTFKIPGKFLVRTPVWSFHCRELLNRSIFLTSTLVFLSASIFGVVFGLYVFYAILAFGLYMIYRAFNRYIKMKKLGKAQFAVSEDSIERLLDGEILSISFAGVRELNETPWGLELIPHKSKEKRPPFLLPSELDGYYRVKAFLEESFGQKAK